MMSQVDMSRRAPLSLLAVLPLLAASPGLAACPALADLRLGVTLVQNAPHFRRADFQITKPGLMETREDRSGFGPRLSVILHGHGLAPFSQVIGGVELLWRYDGELEQLDRLDSLGEVVLTGREEAPDGTSQPLALRFEWLGADNEQLAECNYAVWRIARTRLGDGGEADRAELTYAPALGLVLSEWQITPDGKRLLRYAYGWAGTEADVRR